MNEATDHHSTPSMKAMVTKVLLWALGLAALLGVVGYVAFQVSPWPSALLIRMAFDREAETTAQALEKHVPPGVAAQRNERYDPADNDAYLDVFYPAEIANSERSLPAIVWIHGGGWVSGSKDQIANYAKILAGKGYTVAGVDYSIAPGSIYPTPIRQVNTALSYLAANAKRLHADSSRFVLAGDSGGAHIAAQLANAISTPSYAKALGITPAIQRAQLRGMILYCGAYDVTRVNLDGSFGGFLTTVLWSYSGGKDFMTNPRFATASVIHYVSAEFPPAFISAGNADPLLPQSRAFADAVAGRGVRVDSLFFPDGYKPALPHEYQFNLDTEAGQLALERSLQFLATL
ncbi:MAG: alpha/beta hydrolase [Gammaproteobacteria bacterium]